MTLAVLLFYPVLFTCLLTLILIPRIPLSSIIFMSLQHLNIVKKLKIQILD